MKLDRFINRPVLSTVISILIVILGLLGLMSLPVEQYPNIAPPTIRVNTTYTGANAQTVLNSVIAPLEEQINGVENMDLHDLHRHQLPVMRRSPSTSSRVSDPDMAAVNVQNRVAQGAGFLLPAEVTQGRCHRRASDRPVCCVIMSRFYSSDNRYDQQFLDKLCEHQRRARG